MNSFVRSAHIVIEVCDYWQDDIPSIFEGHKFLPQARSTHALTLRINSSEAEKTMGNPTESKEAGAGQSQIKDCLRNVMDAVVVLADNFYSKQSADLLQSTVKKQERVIAELDERGAIFELELQKCWKDLKACRLSCVSLQWDPQVFQFYTGVTF